MKVKRIVHSILCLVLCCCILLHSMPVKADATAAGLAGTIAVVSGVTVPAPLAIGAAAIALGVMAKNTNPLVFENMVDDAVASLSAAGTWVKDGAVELLQTIDETGQKAYYVAGDMLEDMRNWMFSENYVTPNISSHTTSMPFSIGGASISFETDIPTYPFRYRAYNGSKFKEAYCYGICALQPFSYSLYNDGILKSSGTCTTGNSSSGSVYYYCVTLNAESYPELAGIFASAPHYGYELGAYNHVTKFAGSSAVTGYDLSLGSIPYAGAFTGGTVTDNTFLDFLSKRIRFQNSTDPDNDGSDEDNYNWMVPLTLGAAGTVYAMTQIEQWTGKTPTDFEDYKVVDEMTIVSTPTIGGYPGIIATPKVDFPSQGEDKPFVPEIPQIGGGSTTITPAEGLNGTLSETGAQTFLDSVGTFFGTWFDSILKWLEALWELISSGVISLIDAIKALPSLIGEVFTNVLTWAFVPAASYVDAEVAALCADFPLASTFKGLVTNFRSVFSGFNGEPPVIYIHLEDAEGSYNYGGAVPILDMRWYARYKPIGDMLLSALMWAFFLWRLLVHAPNIIGGLAGDIEAFNSGPSGGIYSSDNPYRSGTFSKPSRGKYESRRK